MFQLFVITIIFGFAAADNGYCSADICPPGKKHIACGNSGKFNSSCPNDARLVTLSQSNIKFILDKHNKLRNKIANGDQTGFMPAARMATMKWNDELAKLAALNVMQCKMKHDECRSTKNFKYAGQNLAYRANSGAFEETENSLEKSIQGWYDEVNDAAQSDIDKCCNSKSGETVGHFTQVVTDRAIEIGCAVSLYTNDNWKTSLTACNYALTNMKGEKVYISGKTASGCSTGKNPNFPALCKDTEPISAKL